MFTSDAICISMVIANMRKKYIQIFIERKVDNISITEILFRECPPCKIYLCQGYLAGKCQDVQGHQAVPPSSPQWRSFY